MTYHKNSQAHIQKRPPYLICTVIIVVLQLVYSKECRIIMLRLPVLLHHHHYYYYYTTPTTVTLVDLQTQSWEILVCWPLACGPPLNSN